MATEIRPRAEIRAGELLAEMKESSEGDAGKAPIPELADIGVTLTQSSH
jgi:hypothetical protein